MSFISTTSNGVRLKLHIQPGAKRTEIVGLHGDSLKIKIHAPPEDGKANAELIRFLAETLGVSRSAVELVSGQTSRSKVVEVAGVSGATAAQVLV